MTERSNEHHAYILDLVNRIMGMLIDDINTNKRFPATAYAEALAECHMLLSITDLAKADAMIDTIAQEMKRVAPILASDAD
jgi:hypothetical protein